VAAIRAGSSDVIELSVLRLRVTDEHVYEPDVFMTDE
jgi:hypothetical protein